MNRESKKDLLIGMILGQIASLLNQIKTIPMTNQDVYQNLFDIEKSASLTVHEIYYKHLEPSVLYSKSLEEIEWPRHVNSRRMINNLAGANIHTVEDVLKHTEYFLLKIPNFGVIALKGLIETFNLMNLKIGSLAEK